MPPHVMPLVRRTAAAILCNAFICKTTVSVLALPASVVYYGVRGWLGAVIRGKPIVTLLLNDPIGCYDSLKNVGRRLRAMVFVPFAIAVRIYQDRGLATTIHAFGEMFTAGAPRTVLLRLESDAIRCVTDIPPAPSRLLVVMKPPEGSHSDQLALDVVGSLGTFGLDVVCVTRRFTLTRQLQTRLEECGAAVIDGSAGVDSPRHYLSRYGHGFGAFYFLDVPIDGDLLELLGAVAPRARIVLHVTQGDVARGPGMKDYIDTMGSRGNSRDAISLLSRLDCVIVGRENDRERLRERLPGIPIGVFRNPSAEERVEPVLDEHHGGLSPATSSAGHVGIGASRHSLWLALLDAGVLTVELYERHSRTLPPIHSFTQIPPGVRVDVSVIVPARDNWEYTRRCLNAILNACPPGPARYEVILADDSSGDDTCSAGAAYPGLQVIRTPYRMGFLRNCNRAARLARGKYLLFLNNDTVVLPGWLGSLYQSAEEDGSAAIVGSKVLYPNGTIQEAGGILWRDGTSTLCGRYEDRGDPRYAYSREVDYVSGASMLVRRSFWESVHGFDERYVDAYCEDSDLAMTARSQGCRVLYQPWSEVIHYESVSYSEQRVDFVHPAQWANIERLREKWKSELSACHLPADTPAHVGMLNAQRRPSAHGVTRRRSQHLNVLYFSPYPSHPTSHGNRSTIREFGLEFQRMGHKVHFALLRSQMYTERDLAAMRDCWDTVDVLSYQQPMEAEGEGIPFDGWYEEGLGESIRRLCAAYDIDVVFCSYIFHSRLLEHVPPHILKVIDTHDKMSNRYEMLRANGQLLEFFSCTPEEEGAYLRRADVVVARRQEEAQYFNRVTGRDSAIVIPHVEPPRFVEKRFSRFKNLGLVASANRINAAIVHEFLATVARRVQEGGCRFDVYLAGEVKDSLADLPATKRAAFRHPWVKMLGFVPDIAEFYGSMDAVVSPVTMGTGINVKTVQAMAFGMPLLSTAWGVKGIETGDAMHAHQDLEALVESVFRLSDNPADLERLAAVSRTRYTSFYEQSLRAMRQLFSHPKLKSTWRHDDREAAVRSAI